MAASIQSPRGSPSPKRARTTHESDSDGYVQIPEDDYEPYTIWVSDNFMNHPNGGLVGQYTDFRDSRATDIRNCTLGDRRVTIRSEIELRMLKNLIVPVPKDPAVAKAVKELLALEAHQEATLAEWIGYQASIEPCIPKPHVQPLKMLLQAALDVEMRRMQEPYATAKRDAQYNFASEMNAIVLLWRMSAPRLAQVRIAMSLDGNLSRSSKKSFCTIPGRLTAVLPQHDFGCVNAVFSYRLNGEIHHESIKIHGNISVINQRGFYFCLDDGNDVGKLVQLPPEATDLTFES